VDAIPTPTPRELEILKVLWEQGPRSVKDVHRHLLSSEPDLAYNTIQTMLRVMEGKGLVGHDLDGRSFIYVARFTRDETAARFLDRVFDGAASELVQSLLRGEKVSADELERMRTMIDTVRRQSGRR
jgi:predicted transcriptional regulator